MVAPPRLFGHTFLRKLVPMWGRPDVGKVLNYLLRGREFGWWSFGSGGRRIGRGAAGRRIGGGAAGRRSEGGAAGSRIGGGSFLLRF